MQLYFKYMDSPVGQLQIVAHNQALVAVKWDTEDPKRLRLQVYLNTQLIRFY